MRLLRLGRIAYYADFYVYPLVIAALAAYAIWHGPAGGWAMWLTAFVSGVALWTLVEYVLHRFVLHHVPFIKDTHDAHHQDQLALIGTPIWISLSIMVVIVLMPLSLVFRSAGGHRPRLRADARPYVVWRCSSHPASLEDRAGQLSVSG